MDLHVFLGEAKLVNPVVDVRILDRFGDSDLIQGIAPFVWFDF